jgi:acetate kinase
MLRRWKLNLLIFNCGSSSLNYKVYAATNPNNLELVCSGKAHRVGVQGSEPSFIQYNKNGESDNQIHPIQNHRQAAVLVLQYLESQAVHIDAIGHRFVHGGRVFQQTTILTEENLIKLKDCLPLAPIHNPNSMSVIDECRRRLPDVPQFLTFDTAFHATLPPAAYCYALPEYLVRKHSLRRYGFHGLSYQYVTQAAAHHLGSSPGALRIVACHLGTGGSSVAAIDGGRSIDTSMGFSPLSGLMMSTRTGDLDPYLPVYMLRTFNETPPSLAELYNKKSGLLGISGFSSDIRDIEQAAQRGEGRAELAFEMYTYRIRKTIGAYAALLGGMDVLIFTDDIGAQDWQVRRAVCQDMAWCGVLLDEHANRQTLPDQINDVSRSDSAVRVLAMPTDEELVIGFEGLRILKGAGYVIP